MIRSDLANATPRVLACLSHIPCIKHHRVLQGPPQSHLAEVAPIPMDAHRESGPGNAPGQHAASKSGRQFLRILYARKNTKSKLAFLTAIGLPPTPIMRPRLAPWSRSSLWCCATLTPLVVVHGYRVGSEGNASRPTKGKAGFWKWRKSGVRSQRRRQLIQRHRANRELSSPRSPRSGRTTFHSKLVHRRSSKPRSCSRITASPDFTSTATQHRCERGSSTISTLRMMFPCDRGRQSIKFQNQPLRYANPASFTRILRPPRVVS
jgi:hypothetical protein